MEKCLIVLEGLNHQIKSLWHIRKLYPETKNQADYVHTDPYTHLTSKNHAEGKLAKKLPPKLLLGEVSLMIVR